MELVFSSTILIGTKETITYKQFFEMKSWDANSNVPSRKSTYLRTNASKRAECIGGILRDNHYQKTRRRKYVSFSEI